MPRASIAPRGAKMRRSSCWSPGTRAAVRIRLKARWCATSGSRRRRTVMKRSRYTPVNLSGPAGPPQPDETQDRQDEGYVSVPLPEAGPDGGLREVLGVEHRDGSDRQHTEQLYADRHPGDRTREAPTAREGHRCDQVHDGREGGQGVWDRRLVELADELPPRAPGCCECQHPVHGNEEPARSAGGGRRFPADDGDIRGVSPLCPWCVVLDRHAHPPQICVSRHSTTTRLSAARLRITELHRVRSANDHTPANGSRTNPAPR